jgi:hypothetical protein
MLGTRKVWYCSNPIQKKKRQPRNRPAETNDTEFALLQHTTICAILT